MARQNIGVGSNKNDGTGDELRAAMQKINANFIELYDRTGTDSATSVSIKQNCILTTGDLVLSTNQAGSVVIMAPLKVEGNLTTTANIGVNTLTPEYDVDIIGNLRVANNTILGTSTSTDSITIQAGFINSLVPKVDNSYDLGFNSLQFRNLYIGTTAFMASAYTPNIITTGGEINGTNIGSSVPANGRFSNLEAIDRLGVGGLILRNQSLESDQIDTDINIVALGAGKVNIPTKLIVGTGRTPMVNPILQTTGNADNFTQIGVQNKSNGKFACSDIVVFTDEGSDFYDFVDMGQNNSGWDGSLQYVYFDLGDSSDTWELNDYVYQLDPADGSSILARGKIDEIVTNPLNAAEIRVRVCQIFEGTSGLFDQGSTAGLVFNETKLNSATPKDHLVETITSTGALFYNLGTYTLNSSTARGAFAPTIILANDSCEVKVNGVKQTPGTDYTIQFNKIKFLTIPAVGATITIRQYPDANYPFTIGQSGDSYLYNNGKKFTIGTMTGEDVLFHVNGIRYTSEAGRIKGETKNWIFGSGVTSKDGFVDTGEKVQIHGNVKINGSFIASGDASITGNLSVLGSTTFVSSQDLIVEDSVINLHTQANLAPLTSNDGRDIGTVLHYYDTADKQAFLGLDNTTKYLKYLVDASDTSGVYTGSYGTFEASTFISTATGVAPFVVNSTVKVANLSVETANIANLAYNSQSVTDNAQPNITSLGTLVEFKLQSRVITDPTGSPGDVVGMVAMDDTYLYRCINNYDGSTIIWRRVAFSLTW